VEMDFRVRFLLSFLYFSFKITPSSSSMLRRPIFIGKNVARFSNLVPQFLVFFL